MPQGGQLLLIVLLTLVNLAISWWNAYAVGNCWVESKHAGGYRRFMAWMGAAMSASGFTWCYLIIVTLCLGAAHKLTPQQMQLMFDIGYVLIIPVVLFAGYAMTFDSWRRAYHQRSLSNVGAAGWNSFASAYNTYNAVEGFGPALGDIFKSFKSSNSSNDDDDALGALGALVLLIVILAGVITTALLIKHYAAREHIDNIARRSGASQRRGRYII